MKLSEYKAQPKKKPSKMLNKITVYNGRKYASIKEANKAKQLGLLLSRKLIKGWVPQVRYKLTVNDILICTYVLDFKVENLDGTFTYIDVKGRKAGVPYQMFQMKQKLMLAVHGITVEEM